MGEQLMDGKKKKRSVLRDTRELGIASMLIVLIIVFSISSKTFITPKNIMNIVRQVSLNGIMACGMTMIILLGDIDLSAGAVYFASAMTCGMLVTRGVPFLVAIPAGILVGALCGMISGFLVAKVGLPAFIATLGMTNIERGVWQTLSGGKIVSMTAASVKAEGLETFLFLGSGKIGGFVPMLVVFFVAILIISFILIHVTNFGFHLKAVGGNSNAARVVGINIERVKILAFTIHGAFCGMVGVLALSYLSSVQGTSGDGTELDAIAAVIMGGTSALGGEGSIIGTLIGVLIMGVLKNGLVLIGVTSFMQTAIIGLVVIASVTFDIQTSKKRR